jgi:hypothetical protein
MMLLGCRSACVNTMGKLSERKERYGCVGMSLTSTSLSRPYVEVNQSWNSETLEKGPAVGEQVSVKIMSNSGCLPTCPERTISKT